MKKLSVVCLMVVASIFMVTHVYAAGAGIGAGSNEAFGQAQIQNVSSKTKGSPNTNTTTMAIYTVGYGRFITDALQLGVSHIGIIGNTDDGAGSKNTAAVYGIDGFAKYHFYTKGQTVVPYVGLQVGYLGLTANSGGGGPDSTGSSVSYGGMGGLKFFLSENFAITTELNYRRYEMKMSPGNDESTSDQISFLVGFAVYF